MGWLDWFSPELVLTFFLVFAIFGAAGEKNGAWMGGAVWLLAPMGIVVGTCALGYWVFNRMAPRIAEEL